VTGEFLAFGENCFPKTAFTHIDPVTGCCQPTHDIINAQSTNGLRLAPAVLAVKIGIPGAINRLRVMIAPLSQGLALRNAAKRKVELAPGFRRLRQVRKSFEMPGQDGNVGENSRMDVTT